MDDDRPSVPQQEPANDGGATEADSAWAGLTGAVVDLLRTWRDPQERDFLVLAVEGPEDEGGCQPYVQFAGFDAGRRVRGEICGPRVVARQWEEVTEQLRRPLAAGGWGGADTTDDNFALEVGPAGYRTMVETALAVLRETFLVFHPSLLTFDAEGPAAGDADRLCLTSADALVREPALHRRPPAPVIKVRDREHLRYLVDQHLRDRFGVVPEVRNGVILLRSEGYAIRFIVSGPRGPIRISTVVVAQVHSRHQAALDLAVLNTRYNGLISWVLVGQQVRQRTTAWGQPFVGEHFDQTLNAFFRQLKATRDDLQLRLGRHRR